MAKQDLKSDPITERELGEYLNTTSDFAFEIRTQKLLVAQGFKCEHGGSYEDPNSNKTRQFDLRASQTVGQFRIRLAVECKNLRTSFPLLVSCVPRRDEESFHEVILSCDMWPSTQSGWTIPALEEKARSIRLDGKHSIYPREKPVGKSCTQVGRREDGKIQSNDKEVYEKWGQAISSAHELAVRACNDGEKHRSKFLCVVLPVLVVPDGTLWTASFDSDGNRSSNPQESSRCSYFLGKTHDVRSGLGFVSYTMSHLEFVTASGLLTMIDVLFGQEGIKGLFPLDHIFAQLQKSESHDVG